MDPTQVTQKWLTPDKLWLVFGFIGQGVFGARMVVQWLVSERAKRSIVPMSFWVLSLVGTTMVLIYAIYRKDPVFIVAQAGGAFIYIRNLFLIRRAGGHGHPAVS